MLWFSSFNWDLHLDAVRESLQHLVHRLHMLQSNLIGHFHAQADLPAKQNIIKSLNLVIPVESATINSPYAWPNEHRWPQMDVQSKVIHPNCSIYSYRANRLYHPNRCNSCRTNPNRVLSNWHKFVPKRRFSEFVLRKWNNNNNNKWKTSELTANASCTSHVSMSVCLRPAFCKILGMPYAGPSNNSLIGSCDTYVKSRTYAFGFRPSSLAFASDMIKQADAPSVYEQIMRIFLEKNSESKEINDSV